MHKNSPLAWHDILPLVSYLEISSDGNYHFHGEKKPIIKQDEIKANKLLLLTSLIAIKDNKHSSLDTLYVSLQLKGTIHKLLLQEVRTDNRMLGPNIITESLSK